MIDEKALHNLIDIAIKEDVGEGDHSTLACIPEENIDKARLIVKEDCIIAGIEVAEQIFRYLDNTVVFEKFIKDGTQVKKGDIAFRVETHTHALLKAERLVLNIMQRMSGIATLTHQYASIIQDLPTKILDTRKTCPGFRMLEKHAVTLGGGMNHRMGLYDMIMLKDNHIDFAGGISKAIKKTHDYLNKKGLSLKIVVEARNLEEIKEILSTGGVYRILIDNFTPEQTMDAVKLIKGQCQTESSGNINLNNIRQYAECGVDYISIGAITHQARSVDLSLKALKGE